MRGEPVAVATIGRPEAVPVTPVPRAVPATTGSVIAFAPPPGAASANETAAPAVDIENGVTVVRSATGGGPMILKMPQPPPEATARGLATAPDPRLVEPSASGPLPKIGPDGARPDHAYAHGPMPLDGRPGIAILIGGMGLDRRTTADAGTLLPDAVSFGFAPYGDDLAGQVLKARQAGHEVILQAPMEGFGPAAEATLSHMLLAEGGNDNRLRWLMGRFTGYAGLGNYLGARLLADDNALRPILKDVASRGLFFVDDGTAQRSVASSLAAELRLPFVRADVVLDAKADAAAMAAAFARLETLARERGVAVGSATGHPETVAALSRFLAEAGKHGVVLVPVSQAASLDQTSPLAGRASAAPH
ncbi:MAG TPA: divergent polysaccharide deacetylase family protein [Lichenihabitans sp.]|nr:divergent polysaccharide deacetylase family protein [Lichenihabitans sp.]